MKKTSFGEKLKTFQTQIASLDPHKQDPGLEEMPITTEEYTEKLQGLVSALHVIPQKYTKTIIDLLHQALEYRPDIKESTTAAKLAPIEITQKDKHHGRHATYILFQLNTKGELFAILGGQSKKKGDALSY